MPLYEYRCAACGDTFEVIRKFSDPPLGTCQKCGGSVRKLLSSPAIQFKGNGWYVTDYSRKGNQESDSGKSSESRKENGSAGGSDNSRADGSTDAKSGGDKEKAGTSAKGTASPVTSS